ncbi:MAG TPA: tRNA (N(6)-L-threonylcarbamoyladenosine(37)-C(2))-methylthiotransferase MtaB [Deltaproteobacteria bacterium]|nr:tRNA (N(6)-L-threonylcarbamoyladenosine(37)-C(2))-methylthiotransferase MtaB [Deltaproteobacteria bacterium]HCY09634.1 tRNA (N(6)-L-threonylcarbamoyladenosine(37)-C(2))-methylthiotransferase MtaB [Deltaproteobacteria bacterium]
MSGMTVAISTLGCKSNQYDSSALEEALRRASLRVVPFPGPADAYIINTCTVTGKTDHESRQTIRKARRSNPDAVVIVTGCYAQVSPGEVSSIEGVDYVVGNPEKAKIVEYLLNGRQSSTVEELGSWQEGTPWTLRASSSSGRTRANLKIQEGCNRACSYCIIPRARGLSKSLPLEKVETEFDTLVEAGYREIILTGIHLGAWGMDLGEGIDITSVLELIEKKGYPCRFRISSLDPDEVTEKLMDILKSSKHICNHLHLTLQSGDDSIIKRMKRPYTRRLFADKVMDLFDAVEGISIGVDVIAGFPGEGEKEFENTFSLLSGLPVSYLHIFPFSKRHGTAAAQDPDQVDQRAIKARCERLHELDEAKRSAFHSRFIGSTASVLVEGVRDRSGLLKGRARNYIQVFLEGADHLKFQMVDASLESLTKGGMAGKAAPSNDGGMA